MATHSRVRAEAEADFVIDLRDEVEAPARPRPWTALVPPEWMDLDMPRRRRSQRTYARKHRMVTGPSVNLLRQRRGTAPELGPDAFRFQAGPADEHDPR